MTRLPTLTTLAMAILTLPATAGAERLRRDPFLPPPDFRAMVQTAGGTIRGLGPKPAIRGILFADGESLVNLNGEIIGVGEEANGYRLIEVGDEHAIFQHDGEIITLALYPDEDNDESAR